MPVLTKINTNSIAEDAITGDKFAGDAYLSNTANQNISGTYSENRLYTSDAYTLSANATVNGNLTLSTVKSSGDVVLTAGGAYTITGTGVLSGGSLFSSTENDLTGMTGTLGSSVINNAGVASGVIASEATGGSGLEDVPGRYFYAYKNNASNQLVTSATFTAVEFESVKQSHDFNTSNWGWLNLSGTGYSSYGWSETEDLFRAGPDDVGMWFFAAQISFYVNAGDLNNPLVQIYHNGNNVMGGYKLVMSSTQTVRHFTANTTGALTLAFGDTVRLYGMCTGTSPYFFGGDTQSIKGTSLLGIKMGNTSF